MWVVRPLRDRMSPTLFRRVVLPHTSAIRQRVRMGSESSQAYDAQAGRIAGTVPLQRFDMETYLLLGCGLGVGLLIAIWGVWSLR
ncbi:hypothetical protein WK17_00180 [Burkholderia multivorans]|nr:hypothetical protein WK17_00180 [Burkholderia multivorans]